MYSYRLIDQSLTCRTASKPMSNSRIEHENVRCNAITSHNLLTAAINSKSRVQGCDSFQMLVSVSTSLFAIVSPRKCLRIYEIGCKSTQGPRQRIERADWQIHFSHVHALESPTIPEDLFIFPFKTNEHSLCVSFHKIAVAKRTGKQLVYR